MAKLKRGILGKFVNVFVERVHSLGQVAEQQSEVRIPNFLIFPDINTLNSLLILREFQAHLMIRGRGLSYLVLFSEGSSI